MTLYKLKIWFASADTSVDLLSPCLPKVGENIEYYSKDQKQLEVVQQITTVFDEDGHYQHHLIAIGEIFEFTFSTITAPSVSCSRLLGSAEVDCIVCGAKKGHNCNLIYSTTIP